MGNLILIVLFLLIIALIVCGVVNSRKKDDDSHSSDNKLVNIIKSKKFGVLMYAIVAITLVAIFGTIFGFYFGGIIRRSSDDEFVYKPANLSNDPVQLSLPYDNTNTSGGASGNGEEAQDSSIDGTAMNGNIVNLSIEEQIAKFAGLESVWNKDDETVLKIAVGDINQNDELELYVITRNRYDEFILNTYYASPGNVWLSDNKRRLVSGVDNEPAVSTLYCYEKDDDFIVAGVFTYEYANAGTVMIERVNSRMEVLDQDHINSFASYYDIADDSIKVYLSNNNWQNPWVSDTEFDFMIMDRLVDYNPLYSYNLSFKDYSEDNIEQLMNESWAEAERASFDNIMINDLLTSLWDKNIYYHTWSLVDSACSGKVDDTTRKWLSGIGAYCSEFKDGKFDGFVEDPYSYNVSKEAVQRHTLYAIIRDLGEKGYYDIDDNFISGIEFNIYPADEFAYFLYEVLNIEDASAMVQGLERVEEGREVFVCYEPDENKVYSAIGPIGWYEYSWVESISTYQDGYKARVIYADDFNFETVISYTDVYMVPDDNRYGYRVMSVERHPAW